MRNGFRQSMGWLHVWSGLVVGWVLFSVFVTGTASYYRSEFGASTELLTLYQRARFDHVRLPPDTAVRARADTDVVLAGLATTGISQ